MPAPRPLNPHEIPSLIILTYSPIDFFKYFSKKPHENRRRGACFVSTFPYDFIFSIIIILYSATYDLLQSLFIVRQLSLYLYLFFIAHAARYHRAAGWLRRYDDRLSYSPVQDRQWCGRL